jgi:MFS family permease
VSEIASAAPRIKFAILFFLAGAALGFWNVNFGNVLRAHGFEHLIGYAYACSGIAAFISPLAVGALADQSIPPVRLVRWLSVLTAAALTVNYHAIEQHWSTPAILALSFAHAVCVAPVFGLSTSIILGSLTDPGREFGPLRAAATVGWMCAGWLISFILHADTSTMSGYAGAIAWLCVSAFTFALPITPPIEPDGKRDVFGLSALELLRDGNHRVVILGAALFSIPMSAFYPYTPIHLTELGVEHATAAMTLGQVSETLCMFTLAGVLARWRLKPVFLAGIAFAALRFALCGLHTRGWLLMGVSLHGFALVLYYITAQIYLEQRVDHRMRARAQALLAVMMSGVGNLIGFLGVGWWRGACTFDGATNWPHFWFGVSGLAVVVWFWFLLSYRMRKN